MLVRAHGFAIQRGLAEHVIVELDVRAGLPAFSVIGLAPGAARDARERVQAALLNSGLSVPRKRVTVNLAPASSRRGGSEFDLAIACCVVAAGGVIDPRRLGRVGLVGELGLGGLLRRCASPGAAAAAAAEAELGVLVVPRMDFEEARAVGALPIAARQTLSEVVALLAGHAGPAPGPAGRDAGVSSGVRRNGRPPIGTPVGGAPSDGGTPSNGGLSSVGPANRTSGGSGARIEVPARGVGPLRARPP